MEVTKTLLPNRSAWYLEYGQYDAYAVDQGGEFLLCRDARGRWPHAAAEAVHNATGTLRQVSAQLIAWAEDGALPRPATPYDHCHYIVRKSDGAAALTGFPAGRAIAFPTAERAAAAIIWHEFDLELYGVVMDVEPMILEGAEV